ncbi:HpcH/HpaI aldolase/citrate lyase family protein [Sphingomonas sp. CJ99]
MTLPVLVARSLLFAPGDSAAKLAKAAASEADIVLCDLEDSVAPANKALARELTAAHLRSSGHAQPQWVRINPLDGDLALADLAAIVPAAPAGIVLPKATPADCNRLHHYLTALEVAAGMTPGGIAVMAIATETAQSIFALGDYSGTPRLTALTWGAEDIATALGASDNRMPDGSYALPFQMFRALALTGAVAAGVTPIETIHGDYRDLAGLEAVATAARRAGFRGMMAIHPAQVAVINRCFTPDAAEVEHAERIVSAFAADPSLGTVGLDGQMLDRPHLERARTVLALARRGE